MGKYIFYSYLARRPELPCQLRIPSIFTWLFNHSEWHKVCATIFILLDPHNVVGRCKEWCKSAVDWAERLIQHREVVWADEIDGPGCDGLCCRVVQPRNIRRLTSPDAPWMKSDSDTLDALGVKTLLQLFREEQIGELG